MNILKLTPSCKDYLWGGSRLRSDFGIKSDLNPLAFLPPGRPQLSAGRHHPCRIHCSPPGLPWHRLREV